MVKFNCYIRERPKESELLEWSWFRSRPWIESTSWGLSYINQPAYCLDNNRIRCKLTSVLTSAGPSFICFKISGPWQLLHSEVNSTLMAANLLEHKFSVLTYRSTFEVLAGRRSCLFEWGQEDDHRTLKSGLHLQLCVDHIYMRTTHAVKLSVKSKCWRFEF